MSLPSFIEYALCVSMMIAVGYENVAKNVYSHESSLRIHGSSYEDRANFGYAIVRHLNRAFSFLGLQKVVKLTCTGCGSRELGFFKIQIARISVVFRLFALRDTALPSQWPQRHLDGIQALPLRCTDRQTLGTPPFCSNFQKLRLDLTAKTAATGRCHQISNTFKLQSCPFSVSL